MKEYLEYLIEYDTENNVVYVSGLDSDGYWDEIGCRESDDPAKLAIELADELEERLGDDIFVTIADVEDYIDLED